MTGHPLETKLATSWPPAEWAEVTVLVAVSGGCDSVALLRALRALLGFIHALTYVYAVKQINRRMKGTEKFWSRGVEGMLTLVADHLSDTPTLARFWRNRPHRLTGSRCRQLAA